MSQVYINCHPRPSPCAPRLTCPPAGYGIPSRGLLLFPSPVARLSATLFPSRSPLCSLALHTVSPADETVLETAPGQYSMTISLVYISYGLWIAHC